MDESERSAVARPAADVRVAEKGAISTLSAEAAIPAARATSARKAASATKTVSAKKATSLAKMTPAKRVRRPARVAVRWTVKREGLFLAELSETSNVAAACRESGLSSAAVYKRRAASDMFRAAWGEALREGYVRLETMVLDRALNGVAKDVWYGGKKVGSTREFSDRLSLALLTRHRVSVTGGFTMAIDPEEADRALAAQLAEMNRRMGGAG